MSKIYTGTVVSDKQDKTVVVEVSRSTSHPLYKKPYTVTKKYHVHDEDNSAKPGDKVEFTDTAPISKNKQFRLTSINNKEVKA
jgi:small subunit ribosomal protein S17